MHATGDMLVDGGGEVLKLAAVLLDRKTMNLHVETTRLEESTKLPTVRDVGERRKLGAYYTPDRLSRLLANWAIRSAEDVVLEPSFGGCGFVTAARDVLELRGANRPASQMYGCDIDTQAFTYLETVFSKDEDVSGFVFSDFMDCAGIENWPEKFSVVLANPPYIPHHRIGRERVRDLSGRDWLVPGVGGRSSLWAYFLCQAIDMLSIGGRMAWVLPGAFLQADYARPIKDYLSRRFDRTVAIIVRDRLFLDEGTDEETVVLLAERHRATDRQGAIEVGEVKSLVELAAIMDRWQSQTWSGDISGASPAKLSMTEKSLLTYEFLERHADCMHFGEIARVRIGIVTGANDFFVLNRAQLTQAGLTEDDCDLVLSKFRAARGAALREGDLDAYADEKGKIFLVTSKLAATSVPISEYLATFDEKRKSSVSTFKKRTLWSQTCDGNIPDAFFPVMHHTGPRLVINTLGCTCTNTVHRVFFSSDISETKRMVAAISFLTSFSQISAELMGRRYGSGVLKHEPRDAEKIRLLMPATGEEHTRVVFEKIDLLLREGKNDAARSAADRFIAEACDIPKLNSESEALGIVLDNMRRRRTPNRSNSSSSQSASTDHPTFE
ncbi:hypothetical protein ASF70_08290 [Rhizobium sp. Leaf321]|nr:hypothetical protein ASF70_08290 [Rhizobium sp. Leaf321]